MAESRHSELTQRVPPAPVERVSIPGIEEPTTELQRAAASAFRAGRIDPGRLSRQAVLALQRTAGNRAVNQILQQHEQAQAARPSTSPQVLQRDKGDPQTGSGTQQATAGPIPDEKFVVPFDFNPLSAPGEQIIFRGDFADPAPEHYQLRFTGVGGTFDKVGGGVKKTIPGLLSDNLFFFIKKSWDGKGPVTVKLEVQRIADSAIVRTYDWTFGKKVRMPSAITQQEGDGEVSPPGIYNYKIGPALHAEGGTGTDYEHETILEKFGQRVCNIALKDLTPEFREAHPDVKTPEQITAHFFGTVGNNSTFTVDNNDAISDEHSNRIDASMLQAVLVKRMDVTCDLPQTYEISTGVVLGRYIIRRIIKADETKWVRKMRAP